MSDALFRTGSVATPPPPADPHVPNVQGAALDLGAEEPVEGEQAEYAVLSALGIEDAQGIPEEDQANLAEATEYVLEIVKQKGATPTQSTVRRALDSLKEELELDLAAEPGVVLERLAGTVRAWKGLSFVRDGAERRRLMMKLARLPSAKAIDEALFREMEERSVWR